jgi:hypothetical protein
MLYVYTVEQFKEFVDLEKRTASYLVPVETPHDLVQCDEDGLNSKCCDDAVEGGYLLGSIHYKFEVKDSKVFIRVTADDASEWIDEFIH